jgi:LysM domain.
MATDQLLMLNGLAGGCANWPGNLTSLCVQNTCEPYLVQQNDTCLSVAAAYNATLSQLLSWNPTIDPICSNWNTKIGHVICVGNPAGYTQPNLTDIGSISGPGPATTPAPVPTDAMNGSNTDCGVWYTVNPGDGKHSPLHFT